MDMIMEEPGPVQTVTGAGGEESIQIHGQAFVNIGIAPAVDHDQDKSIAEKESEVLSLIILNSQDGSSSNIEITANNILKEGDGDEQLITVQEDNHHQLQQHQVVDDVLKADQLQGADFVGGAMVTMEFHAADAAWITLLDRFELLVNDNRIRGYVEGEKQFLCLWESFQTSTMSTFSVRSSDKFYRLAGEGEEGAVNGRILKGAPKWSRTPLIPYDGVPFISIDRKYFGCRLGGAERKNSKKGQFKTTRTGHSLKVGCPADADVLEIWRVPDLALPDNIKSNREKRRMKTQLLSQVNDLIQLGRFTKRYYVTLPLITKHQNHPVLDNDAGRLKILHPRIIEKIYEIVQQGIYEKRVIKYMLQEFVQEFQNELGIEIQESDRSFYPTDRDISNHIRNAKCLVKKEALKESALVKTTAVEDEIELPAVGSDGDIQQTTSGLASFNAEVVTTPAFTDISSNCEVTYEIGEDDSSLYNTVATVSENTNFAETIVDTSNTSYADAKNFLSAQDVTTLEDIVQQYYHQNSNMEVTTNEEETAAAEIMEDQSQPVVVKIETAASDNVVTTEMDVNELIEHCKRNPNPTAKKKARKWPQKPARALQKQMDLKSLLKCEIDNSFAAIKQSLVNEHDETKLKIILKKAKVLQRIAQGRELVKRRGRRSGIHAMVDIENNKKEV